ncbi:hypothetical protein, partial [Mariprofundus ferrooxydans]|uniref:hypothetical protein n=1 Tax=Mariprofundus ferrooxydans TaxID=314344 RepID=UPI001F3E9495
SMLHGLNSPGRRFAVSITINLPYPLGIQTFFYPSGFLNRTAVESDDGFDAKGGKVTLMAVL